MHVFASSFGNIWLMSNDPILCSVSFCLFVKFVGLFTLHLFLGFFSPSFWMTCCTIWALGPRELTGAVDLINHYKLLPHHDFFCKRSLPLSISDTHYLHHVVGDTDIRKGEGMQLDQLIQNTSYSRDTNTRIQPFDLDILKEAFQLRETAPVDLPLVRNPLPWNTFGALR